MLARALSRSLRSTCRAASTRADILAHRRALPPRVATSTYQARAHRKQHHLLRSLLVVALAGGAAQLYLHNGHFLGQTHAEENAIVFEESRKKSGVSKEENRDLISSQHQQVKRSWENPGVYAWGSNVARVVAPESGESVIKTPRRIPFFDGKLLRDLKLDRTFGAAIDEHGALLQWGTGFMPDCKAPVTTLKGKDLVSLALSRDRILALGSNGKLYTLPVSASEQESRSKPAESTWLPFWNSRSSISYRLLSPNNMSYTEKITSLSSGLEHALLLTSKGRLFSLASASDSYPSRGQLGVPGLTWLTRPVGDFDQPHEITTLRGFAIAQVACGDNHSLALDKEGRVFSWGDNSSGQLGFDYNAESAVVDAPSLLPLQKLYSGSSQVPVVTAIAAGGSSSYLTVDATKVASQLHSATTPEERAKAQLGIGKVTADTFAFGTGIAGQLGNGRWTHVQSKPTKIPSLSGLFEYDEQSNKTVPIRLARLSVGQTHAAAVMRNITYLSASAATSSGDTNWGADVVFWGGNQDYQLGTGKRNNSSSPIYLQPLDAAAELARAKKSSGVREEHRFHITPRSEVRLGDGRWRSVEQRVECGRGVSGVYSGV